MSKNTVIDPVTPFVAQVQGCTQLNDAKRTAQPC